MKTKDETMNMKQVGLLKRFVSIAACRLPLAACRLPLAACRLVLGGRMFRHLPLAAACAFALVGIAAIPADTPARQDGGAVPLQGEQTTHSGAAFNLADYHQWRDNLDHRGGIGGFRPDAATTNGAGDNGANFGANSGDNFHTGNWHFNLPVADIADLSGFAADAINNGGDVAFADLYRRTQMRIFSDIDSALSRGAESVITGNFAAVRQAQVQLQTELGGREGNIGINILGTIDDTGDTVVGWQLRGYGGDSYGSNAGIFYRVPREDHVFGVNAFWDYENGDYGNFSRFGIGGEVWHPAAAFAANFYAPISGERSINSTVAAFSRRGFDARLRVSVPFESRLNAAVDYYNFDGKRGTKGEVGFRYGAELGLMPGLRLGVHYDNADTGNKIGGEVSYSHTIGEVQSNSSSFPHRQESPDLYAAVNREYSQRVATVAIVTMATSTPPPMTMTMTTTMTAEMTTTMTAEMTTTMTAEMTMTMTAEMTMTMALPPPSAMIVNNADHPPIGGVVNVYNLVREDVAVLTIPTGLFLSPPTVYFLRDALESGMAGTGLTSILHLSGEGGFSHRIDMSGGTQYTSGGATRLRSQYEVSLSAPVPPMLSIAYQLSDDRFGGSAVDTRPDELLTISIAGPVAGGQQATAILTMTVSTFADMRADENALDGFVLGGAAAPIVVNSLSVRFGYGNYNIQLGQQGGIFEANGLEIRSAEAIPAIAATYPPTSTTVAVLTIRLNDESTETPEIAFTTTVNGVAPISASIAVLNIDNVAGGQLPNGSYWNDWVSVVYALGGAGTPTDNISHQDAPGGGRERGYQIRSADNSVVSIKTNANYNGVPDLRFFDASRDKLVTVTLFVDDRTGGDDSSGNPSTDIPATPTFTMILTLTLF